MYTNQYTAGTQTSFNSWYTNTSNYIQQFPKELTAGTAIIETKILPIKGIIVIGILQDVYRDKKPFEEEKEFFEELKQQKDFLKINERKFIAIKNREILKIDNNFSRLVNAIFSKHSPNENIFITKITKNELVAYFGGPS
jgi:hypothetical protein